MSRSTVAILVVVVVVLLWSRPVFAVKQGVILGTKPEMEYARRIVASIWKANGYQLTIVSGYDGTHMAQSKHYEGLAEDYRTRDVTPSDLARMASAIRSALGSFYDVVVESDHLHVEYDPKV